MLRFLATLSLAFLLILALAWPLSVPGVTFSSREGGTTRSVSLAFGAAWFVRVSSATPAFDRPSYRVALEPPFAESSAPGAMTAPGTFIRRAGLRWLTAAPAATFAVSLTILAVRQSRRRRRGLCPVCAYPKPAAEAPCPECGAPPREAQLRARAFFTVIPRDAAFLALAGVLTVALAVYGLTVAERRSVARDEARSKDPSWYAEITAPRLSGGLVVASPDTYPNAILSGASVIVLLPGRFEAPGARQRSQSPMLMDQWYIGAGPDKTTLVTRISAAARVRFENLAFDCDNAPFLDARSFTCMAFLRCRFFNFNSGSGGSNALYAQDCALLFDDCDFEGMSGRRGSFGSEAMDLRGDSRILLRNTRFVDTEHVTRRLSGLIDRCTVTITDRVGIGRFMPPYIGTYLERGFTVPKDSLGPVSKNGLATTEALDDLDPLRRLLRGAGPGAYTDPRARQLAETLGLARDPAFWRRLLFSPSAEVRALAAEAAKVATPAMPSFEDAMGQLDQDVVPLPAAAAILADPEKARAALTPLAAAEGPSPKVRLNAQGLLQLVDRGVPLADLLRADAARPPESSNRRLATPPGPTPGPTPRMQTQPASR